MTQLKDQLQELEMQLKCLEDAIASLSNPTEMPSGNSFADVLMARFEKLDTDEERQRSMRTAQAMLREIQAKFEAKQREYKQVADRVTTSRSAFSEAARRVNQLTLQLHGELEQLHGTGRFIEQAWKLVHGPDSQPVVELHKVSLPFITHDTGKSDSYLISEFEPPDER